MDWLAQGVEVLADEGRRDAAALRFDVVIVGSGYGGAVMAARLARLRRADGARLRIAVLERGREYVPGEFPNDLGMLPGAVRVDRADRSQPIGNPDALFHVHVDRDVCVLTGSALGGTSQINANVAIEAGDDVLRGPQWPRVFRETPGLLDAHYAQARRTLGVVDYPGDVPKARAFAAVAPHIERRHLRDADPKRPFAGARLKPAPLAVRFAAADDAAAPENPAGVAQKACIECGDCVSGCNHWAKNTLTMNYLPLARRRGVRLFTGATVQHLRPDPEGGWFVTVDATVAETRPVRSARIDGGPMQLRAARVVLCAGALGSTEILLRSRAVHALSLSPRLGAGFSTNGDMISAAYWQRDPVGAVGLGAAAGGDPDAHAHPDTHAPTGSAAVRPRVGPTITSIVDLRDARVRERRILIEDGAVPGALGDVFGEVLASAALLPQRVRWKTQAQRHRDPDMDPEGFGVSDTATHHSQLLLSIGHDDARGVLALKSGRDDDGFRRVRIDWQGDGAGAPSAQAQPVYRHQADLLRGVEARGAIHLENPLWRPVPEALASALGAGALPQGVLVSVHPLGGCRMADDAADGVCNAQGEVFVGPHGTSVHAGLFVCDGSILPSSLGANPFLTIAALAERCAGLLVRQMMETEGLVVCDEMDPLPAPPVLRPAPPIGDRRVAVVFEERMRGRPEQLDDAAALVPIFGERLAGLQRARAAARRAKPSRDDLPMPGGTQAGAGTSVRDHGPVLVDAFDRERAPFLALDVRLEIADLRDYVRTLGRSRRSAPVAAPRVFGQLRILQDRSDLLAGQDVDPFGDCSIELSNGRFDLFVERRAWALRRLGSGVMEFARLGWRHRPGPGSPPPETVRPQAVHPEGGVRGVGHALRRAMAWIAVKASLMRHLGTERTIDYRFDFVGRDGRAYRLVGRKRLAFADALNPWLSVADADFEIHARNAPPGIPVWSGRLRLDPLEIVQYRVPQVTHAPHAPESIVQMASYGLLFARAILGTHLLHFRAPDYLPARPFDDTPHGAQPHAAPDVPDVPDVPEDASPGTPAHALPDAPAHASPAPPAGASARRRRWPGPLPGTRGPVHHRIAIEDDPLSPGLHIALTHYAPPASTVPRHMAPVLVFHGILHSTLAFATDTVDENLTQALCRAGYDVWLVDFRTSIAFGDDPQPLSFDQIARHDVPAAVRHVLERSGAGQVNVFAHCMGAAVFSMALLGRWVDPRTIRALVYCQVSFLVANAYGNRLRAEVSAFVRDALAFDRINPRADASADALERLLDRVATTMPVPPAERDAHRARTPVDPFGVHRVAMPSDAATCNRLTLLIGRHWFHHNLDPRTHAALGELLGPSRIETFFQIQHFGLRGRVMTALGDNAYVTDENLRHAFGALPVLFIQGAESDVFDTRTTRLAHRKLRAVTGLDHRIRLYPGYGHLECVFGRDASTVVYPDVVRFFDAPPSNVAQPAAFPAGPDPMAFPPRDGIPALPDAAAAAGAAAGAVPGAPAAAGQGRPVVRAPWIGPVLGAARPDPDDPDRLLVRVWFAPDTRVTDAPWGWVEYRGALSRFASPQARFAATRWPAGTQGGPVMPRHVLREIAFRRPGAPVAPVAGGRGGGGGAPVEACAGDHGVILGTVGLSLGDAWSARDLGADHVQTFDASVPASPADVPGPPPWVDPPEAFLARAVRLRPAQVAGLLRRRGQATHTRMLLASCRHPGNFFERDRSDAIFGPMLQEVDAVPPVTHALLVGDQVYADATANVFRTEQPAERWEALYRSAFDTPRMRDFLRQVPTLMVADDHEIEDDWAGVPPASVTDPVLQAARPGALRLAQQARAAYAAFQWSHGAGSPAPEGAATDGAPPLWYATCIAGFDYFVLDCRFERTITPAGEAGAMLSDAQFDALDAWLRAGDPDRPCFLVSPSALWPVNDGLLGHEAYARRHDGWLRYPAQAARLVELLWRHPRRLVLLSGDAHCSLGARVEVREVGGPRRAAFEVVVSSALYAPYPFANEHAADYGVPGVERRHRIGLDATAVEFAWRVDYAVDAPGFTVVEAARGAGGWVLSASVRDAAGLPQAAATWT